MKLLLYDMGTYTQGDLCRALDRMKIEYRSVMYKLKDVTADLYFERKIEELIQKEKYTAVFSVNFFPVLAVICERFCIPYLSWTYDSPLMIPNLEKYLGMGKVHAFFFDRAEAVKYKRKGFDNVYHLPLAVDTERLDALNVTKADRERFGAQISMVGQLYETSLNALMMPMTDYEKGYLSAVIEAQFRLYGAYILEEAVTGEILERVNESYRKMGQSAAVLTKDGLVIAMAKQITHMERILLLDALSEAYDVKLYGPGTDENLTKVKWMGSAGYSEEMPKVFRCSKINLNCSLKCIQSGIPLRALDIMGSGGFLLSNWQPELAENFVDGEDLVLYTSLEDAVAKCQYYLEHEEERARIAENGYRKVREYFDYEEKIKTMLQVAGL